MILQQLVVLELVILMVLVVVQNQLNLLLVGLKRLELVLLVQSVWELHLLEHS